VSVSFPCISVLFSNLYSTFNCKHALNSYLVTLAKIKESKEVFIQRCLLKLHLFEIQRVLTILLLGAVYKILTYLLT